MGIMTTSISLRCEKCGKTVFHIRENVVVDIDTMTAKKEIRKVSKSLVCSSCGEVSIVEPEE